METLPCVRVRARSIDPLITQWWVVIVSKHSRLATARRRGWQTKAVDPSAFAIARAAKEAREAPCNGRSNLSAKRPAGRLFVGVCLLVTGAACLSLMDFGSFSRVWLALLCLFTGLGILRALACLVPAAKSALPDRSIDLEVVPMWSIIVALYDEADCVPGLLDALFKLDWMPEKLDIIFACERDDTATLEALTRLRGRYNFRIVRVPKGGPRTKPNALQTALPFVRGRFVTVYDAEDRPDPAQVRAAFYAFIHGPANLAVVQAPLVTWNHNESWIARQFALDYAIWFRVILPALSRLSKVLPLGGTSNHFRTDVLRHCGGWDPYNVTEDADLGIRMGRYGYLADIIAPPTYEEAPPRVGAWIKQRGRWIHGHIQTFSVHLRTPFEFMGALSWRGFLSFLIGLGIGPLSAILVLPVTLCAFTHFARNTFDAMGLWLMALGFVGHGVAAYIGARRDGRLDLLTAVASLPVYYCLQSFAACRAFWRVVFTPSIWDKTDHGKAARRGTSRHPN
jgi:glycosyltransferase XagB